MPDFESKRITVMGLGRFGGGVEVTRFLCSHGAQVLVTDLKSESDLAPSIESIRDLIDSGQAVLRLGEHNISDFTTADLVVANPAVPRPWDNRYLRAARAANIPITTEIGLTVAFLDRERTIGVTGSNGKSTTSAMIAHALRELEQPVQFGGNIGGSLLQTFSSGRSPSSPDAPSPWTVLELSSFMLYWLSAESASKTSGWSPRLAIITNLSPNHLDWHGDLEHYTRSKQQLLHDQRPGDFAILGPGLEAWPVGPGVVRIPAEQATELNLSIPGRHNQVNAAMARAAVRTLVNADAGPALRTFPGLPHRLQFVGRNREGVAFYNDSKATTPDATLLAIDAFTPTPGPSRVHLIVGGYDKKIDLGPLAARAADLAGLYTIGATGPSITARAAVVCPDRVHECRTLSNAVARAAERARPGDIILLSPGCASWDQFENYEQRGDQFAALATQLSAGGAPR